MKIGLIFQDITDKDNLTSLTCLSKNTSIETELRLIGFRLYKSLSLPFGPPHGPTLALGPDFPNHKPDTDGWGTNKILGEYFKPCDVRAGGDALGDDNQIGNICFLRYRTLVFNRKAQEGFINVLMQNPFSQEKYIIAPFHEDCIVDGVETQSLSGKSPMNMTLYYFTKDSYMEEALELIGGKEQLIGNKENDLMDIKGKNREQKIHDILGTKKNPSSEELIDEYGGPENVLDSLKDYAKDQQQIDDDWYKKEFLSKVEAVALEGVAQWGKDRGRGIPPVEEGEGGRKQGSGRKNNFK